MSEIPISPLDHLLPAALRGDRSSIGQLLNLFRPLLLQKSKQTLPACIRPKVSDSDVVQDTILRAIRAWPEFRGTTEGELVAWLLTIENTQLINLIEKFAGTAKRNPRQEQRLGDSKLRPVLLGQLIADSVSPSGKAIMNEQTESVLRAVAQLPAVMQRVVRLTHGEGKEIAEVAAIIGKSKGATSKIYWRAIRKLQEIVKSAESV